MLRRKMAELGFESNEDYEYRLRCLLEFEPIGLRSCVVEGEVERRKTAFANALAKALDWEHVLYHDFSVPEEPVPPPTPDDDEGEPMTPLTVFDRVMSEACAFSEAESTIVILDQLHRADFRQHLRLYHFVTTCEWTYPLATLRANSRRFLLILISAEPLYHSLAKESFRIWCDPGSTRLRLPPAELGLDDDAVPLLEALDQLFESLDVAPTQSEYKRVVADTLRHARTVDHLRQTIFAWIDAVPTNALTAVEATGHLERVLELALDYNGVDEIEL